MKLKQLAPWLTAIISFVLFYVTHSASLGFADDAEFALVTHLGGIAHPPGFPAYVYLGWLWGKLLSFLPTYHAFNMMLFSMLSAAAASALLYRVHHRIISHAFPSIHPTSHIIICILSALSFSTGVTVWLWSNAVEVYAFHTLCMALLLEGLTRWQFEQKGAGFIALGLGLGLANHHLTLILFLPFMLFFFFTKLFPTASPQHHFSSALRNKKLYVAAALAFGLMSFFYALMVVRAQEVYPFEFGNPNTWERFWFHLKGGSWGEQTMEQIEGLASLRFPYFARLIWQQFLLFTPFIIGGWILLIQRKQSKLLFVTLGYFLLLLIYQLRIYQFADTDTYMLLPFMVASIWVVYALAWMVEKKKELIWLAAGLLILQTVLNFPYADKRDYSVSENMMRELTRSAPVGSIVMISDWTPLMQYYYFRVAEDFRPDLVVLKTGVKFTNIDMLAAMYPEFYEQIRPEYEKYIEELGKVRPDQLYGTGAEMASIELVDAYTNMLFRIIQISDQEDRAFLRDVGAFLFHAQNEMTTYDGVFSGAYLSSMETDASAAVLDLEYDWLHSPLLEMDAAAVNEVRSLEVLLDFYQNSLKNSENQEESAKALSAYREIQQVLRKMEKRMPFINVDK